jgi:uncharacterized protein (TIGR00730 family)
MVQCPQPNFFQNREEKEVTILSMQLVMNGKNQIVKREEIRNDFRQSLNWRVLRMFGEFIDGFQFIADFQKTVTFFGSARFRPNNKWYQEAQALGYRLAQVGFAVVTGGGPGIMEAGNRGAYQANGHSIGLNIQLPYEQRINGYITRGIGFNYFFTRKTMLSYSAQAYVFFPGGFGTLDELYEILTLIQTKKIDEEIPVVLVGREYWTVLLNWTKEVMYEKFHAIDREDMDIYTLVDTADEAFEVIKKSKQRKDLFF